jgi:hypothetical protein
VDCKSAQDCCFTVATSSLLDKGYLAGAETPQNCDTTVLGCAAANTPMEDMTGSSLLSHPALLAAIKGAATLTGREGL